MLCAKLVQILMYTNLKENVLYCSCKYIGLAASYDLFYLYYRPDHFKNASSNPVPTNLYL